MSASRVFVLLCVTAAALFGAGCGGGTLSPAHEAQLARIKQEPRGSHYIGRRYFVEKTRFWGYLRRPGEPWDTAKLVVINEDLHNTPDRLPERPRGAHGYGFDHNYEYKLFGRYTGETIYDPNANLFLPEFQLERYELVSEDPGWLFDPNDVYNPKRLPKRR